MFYSVKRVPTRPTDTAAKCAGDVVSQPQNSTRSPTRGETFVAGDVDGDGAADFQIRLEGVHDLTITDFVLQQIAKDLFRGGAGLPQMQRSFFLYNWSKTLPSQSSMVRIRQVLGCTALPHK